jgi:ParB/RepB/Spo0J family partition protein
MIYRIPIDRIQHNPYQYRLEKDPDGIEALARSIGQNGLQQPPKGRLMNHPKDLPGQPPNPVMMIDMTVAGAGGMWAYLEQHPHDHVQLNFGHRRLAAHRWLAEHTDEFPGDWTVMPVDVVDLTNEQMYIGSFIENDHRVNPTPIERAQAVRTGLEDFGWSMEEIAEKLGLSRSVASNAMRLLKLPKDVQDDLHTGRLSERQGLALLPLFDVDQAQARAHHFDVSVQAILGEARRGVSSDAIRERVADAVRWLGNQVQPTLVTAPGPAVSNAEPPRVQQDSDDDLAGDELQQRRGELVSELGRAIKDMRSDEPAPGRSPDAETPEDAPVSAYQSVSPAAMPQLAPAAPAQPTEEAQQDEDEQAGDAGEQQPARPAPAASIPWEKSTIMLTVTLMPQDNYGDGLRPAMIGLRANEGAPRVRLTRLPDNLANIALSAVVTGLVQEMQAEFTPTQA